MSRRNRNGISTTGDRTNVHDRIGTGAQHTGSFKHFKEQPSRDSSQDRYSNTDSDEPRPKKEINHPSKDANDDSISDRQLTVPDSENHKYVVKDTISEVRIALEIHKRVFEYKFQSRTKELYKWGEGSLEEVIRASATFWPNTIAWTNSDFSSWVSIKVKSGASAQLVARNVKFAGSHQKTDDYEIRMWDGTTKIYRTNSIPWAGQRYCKVIPYPYYILPRSESLWGLFIECQRLDVWHRDKFEGIPIIEVL